MPLFKDTKTGKTFKRSKARPGEVLVSEPERFQRPDTQQSRAQLEEQQRQKLLGGIKTDPTRAGAELRGEKFKTPEDAPGQPETQQLTTLDKVAQGQFDKTQPIKSIVQAEAEGMIFSEVQKERILSGKAEIRGSTYIDLTPEPVNKLKLEHYMAALGIPLAVQGISALAANIVGFFTTTKALVTTSRELALNTPSTILKGAKTAGAAGTKGGFGATGGFGGAGAKNAFFTNVQVNGKVGKLIINNLVGGVSAKTASSRVGQWLMWTAGASLLGLWGGAEAPEPITFAMTKVIRLAEQTGDYTLYEDMAEMRDELLNLPIWLYPIFGILNKIKGIKEQAGFMDRYILELREFHAGGGIRTGGTETAGTGTAGTGTVIGGNDGMASPAAWEARDIANHERELEQIRLNEESQARITIMINEAKIEGDAISAQIWINKAKEVAKINEATNKENVENWRKYQLFIYEMQENQRPSNLKFGLL